MSTSGASPTDRGFRMCWRRRNQARCARGEDRPGRGQSQGQSAGSANSDLDGRGWRCRVELGPRKQGWLGHKARFSSSVRLRRMNDERMAQEHRAGRACRQADRAIAGGSKAVCRQLPQGCASLAVRQELASDHGVRSSAYAGRRVIVTDVGQQEEHQERPSAALDVGPSFHEVGRVAEAHVDVPAIVPRR